MWMTESQIVILYRDAKFRDKEIKILAQLNDCSADTIKLILKKNGADIEPRGYKREDLASASQLRRARALRNGGRNISADRRRDRNSAANRALSAQQNAEGGDMNARLSRTTAKTAMSDIQKEACTHFIEELWKKKQNTITRRFFAAMCLAGNDLYHLGDKRLVYLMNGIADILEDYSKRAFSPSESRKLSIGDDDTDPILELMQAELNSRPRLHIEIGDFVK